MPRPNKPKRVKREPVCDSFFPKGKAEQCHEIEMSVEEYETLRLLDYEGMTQAECAKEMGIARATVQSLYTEARKKTARFLVEAAGLRIRGGNFLIEEDMSGNGRGKKGVYTMKIAVTYENGEVFQHFGHTEQFKLYDIENGKVVASEVVGTNGSGHGALAGFLAEHQVQVLICGGIGGGAQNALAQAGIKLFGGCSGNADQAVEALLEGQLNYDADVKCSHHDHEHGEGGHQCGNHGCGSHSCH